MKELFKSKKHSLALLFLVTVTTCQLLRTPFDATTVTAIGMVFSICIGGQAAIDHKSAGKVDP